MAWETDTVTSGRREVGGSGTGATADDAAVGHDKQAAARYAKLKGDLAPRRRVHMFQERPERAPLRGMPMIDYRPASK